MKKIIITIIILLAANSARSQVEYFDFFNFDPYSSFESLILDPNYDAQGKITSYSLGDIVQMEYIYNDQGLLVRKEGGVWDRDDYEWQNLFNIDYNYENGLLSEVSTDAQGFKTIRRIRDGGASRVDTLIMSFVYGESSDYVLIEGYEPEVIVTLRYRNKKNLPDSCVTVFEREDYRVVRKEIFSYNKKNEPVGVETWWKSEDYDWKMSYRLDIDRLQGVTTYRYTAVSPIPDLDDYAHEFGFDSWDELLAYEGDDDIIINTREFLERELGTVVPAGAELCRLEVTSDKNGRMTGRKVWVRGECLSDASFSYGSDGRTNVQHTINVSNARDLASLMPAAGMDRYLEGMNLYFRYTVENDGHGYRKSSYYMKGDGRDSYYYYDDEDDEDEAEEKEEKERLVMNMYNWYSPEGIKTAHQYERWYSWGDFDDRYRVDYEYSPDGLTVQMTESRSDYYDDPLEDYSKTVIVKDSEGRILTKEYYLWSDYHDTWSKDSKRSYRYEGGQLVYEEYLGYDYPGDVPERGHNFEYQRDSYGRITKEKRSDWSPDGWIADYEEKKDYDERGNVISYEQLSWNRYGELGYGTNKNTKRYDENGKLTEHIEYDWDRGTESWVNYSKEEYIRESDDNGNNSETTIYYSWEDGDWFPVTMSSRSSGPDWLDKKEARWSPRENDWMVIDHQREYREDEYWVNEYVTASEGSQHHHRSRVKYEGSTTVNIYSAWDQNQRQWYDTLRYSSRWDSEAEVHEYIFENHDRASGQWLNERKVLRKDRDSRDTVEVRMEFLWDNGTSDWIGNRKVEDCFSYYSRNYWTVHYVFDRSTGEWLPQNRVENMEIFHDEDTLYSVWDQGSRQWRKNILYSGDYWDSQVYIWNEDAGAWRELKLEISIEDFLEQLDKQFNISYHAVYN